MKRIALLRGQGVPIGNGGPTLVVQNNPYLDWGTASLISAPRPITVLVGFDSTPARPASAAYVVPPFSQAVIPVPTSVGNVNLVYPQDPALGDGEGFGVPGQPFLFYDWSSCPVPIAQTTPLRPDFPFGVGGTTLAGQVYDAQGNLWPPLPAPAIYDQQLAGNFSPHLRPGLAPSQIVTLHAATAINTLANLTGVNGSASQLWKVVKRLVVSVSAATLFVVGDNGLTIGSPGADETGRIAFAAAGIQVLEYDEGLELDLNAAAGSWKYYTSAAVTLDLTAVLG